MRVTCVLFISGILLTGADAVRSVKQLQPAIERNDYGKGSKTEVLDVKVGDTKKKIRTDIEVSERRYTTEEIYWIRIDSTKGRTYSKPITKEIQSLVQASIEYTKKKYGVEDYVFVSKKNPEKPMAYTTMTYHLQKAIRELDLRDDKGRPFTPKTHIFRHCYGVKLTELHIPDETIAELLGHKNTDSVSYYRKISNKVMAKETRKSREKMDDILRDIINQWDGYEVVE